MTSFKNKLCAFWKDNKKYVIFCACFFALSLVLISLVPLFGDDWMWGSYRGEELLSSWFEGYNGRYVSNLLILGMTRSMVFRNITVALFFTLIVILPSLLLKRKSLSLLSFSALLLMLTPKSVLVQGALWSSGFSNYVPPACFILGYLVLIRSIINEKPDYTKKQSIIHSVISFFLGFVGALFVETATICAVVVSLLAIAYAFLKYRKIYAVHVSYSVSSLLGAFFMFTNAKNDGYRDFPTLENIKGMLTEHTELIIDQLFVQGAVFFGIISAVLLLLTFKKLGQMSKKVKVLSLCTLSVNGFSLALLFVQGADSSWVFFHGHYTASALVSGFVALAYYLSLGVLAFICIDDKAMRLKALVCLGCGAVLVAPMLVVEPYGPRCLFPAVIFIIAYGAILLCNAKDTVTCLSTANGALCCLFIGATAAIFIYLISVYSTITYYYVKRDAYIEKQLELGHTEITVSSLPYSSYTWHANIDHKTWGGRYKMFHEIDENVVFKALTPEKFDAWALEFDKSSIK